MAKDIARKMSILDVGIGRRYTSDVCYYFFRKRSETKKSLKSVVSTKMLFSVSNKDTLLVLSICCCRTRTDNQRWIHTRTDKQRWIHTQTDNQRWIHTRCQGIMFSY